MRQEARSPSGSRQAVDGHTASADHLLVDPQDEQPDSHAAAREQREAKRRRGMQVSGRSTRSLLPDVIARRGREATQRLRPHAPHGRRIDDDEDAQD